MFKSKIKCGSIQEVILPDFPDDDTTVTTTTTRSRRVSFGTNFVKEFIVGSAVSAQCVSEYEQAFSSSDSSNANSSHSVVNSSVQGQSTFTVENIKSSIGQNTFTIENHKEQFRQSTFTIENQKENIKQNTTFTVENQKENHTIVDKTYCEFDSNENHPKRPKISRTICFNVDSPTADMEFTEGCITLAKSILGKKNQDMRVIIQAETKEEGKNENNESTKHFGSSHDMNLTQCITGKENKRNNKSFQGEKSKIFNSIHDETSFTENCTLFGKKQANISESCLNDSLKENQMPLDLIMQQLDKNSSDSDDSLYPEKTLNAALNISVFDSDEKEDKLSLNESMDISLDFPPEVIKEIIPDECEEQFQHLNNTNEFDKHLLSEESMNGINMTMEQSSEIVSAPPVIECQIAKNQQSEERENSLETEEFAEIKDPLIINENNLTEDQNEKIVKETSLGDCAVERSSPEKFEETLNGTNDFDKHLLSEESMNGINMMKNQSTGKISEIISELPIGCQITEDLQSGQTAKTEELEEINNDPVIITDNNLTEDQFEKISKETSLSDCEVERSSGERFEEIFSDTNEFHKQLLIEESINGNNMIIDQSAEKISEIITEPPVIECQIAKNQQTEQTTEMEEFEEINNDRVIINENNLTEDQSEKIVKETSLNDCEVERSSTEKFEKILNDSSLYTNDILKEENIEKVEGNILNLSAANVEIEPNKISEESLADMPLSENKIVEEPVDCAEKISLKATFVESEVTEDQLTENAKIDMEASIFDDKVREDEPMEIFEENSLNSLLASGRSIDQPSEDITLEPFKINNKTKEVQIEGCQANENSEALIGEFSLNANENNEKSNEFEVVNIDAPLIESTTVKDQRTEKAEETIEEPQPEDSRIADNEIMEVCEEIIGESGVEKSRVEENCKIEKFENITKDPPLVDSRVIEDLKVQSKEINCLWTLQNWIYRVEDNAGMWEFRLKLLESYSILKFHLIVGKEENTILQSLVQSSNIQLEQEVEPRLKEYQPTLEFGYEHQKEYLEEKKKMVKTVRQIPYFLDLMNSYMIKLNSYLTQIYSILTLYPGSRLENSILTFRLFSFPIFFSCEVSINLNDLYQLSKSSISFEYDFGELDEDKIRDIFEECLKSKNSLVEFVVESTKYLIGIERESGRVSKRSYIRLLPPEIRY